ncbi:hypothetical protein OIU74_024826 [Salix koriyanagi]|uniref:RING-type domain-containing protein n=1 Tax=Salix koriyanagi TaxID=2511006 RepID=A0A9Q0W7P7_9ROSI|nr:hypothetical protein OIU74_024826 [Salix koriyanagi]
MESPELPECPVCLSTYDGECTIPRVLPCGHTTCESCLKNIPQKYPLTIRCPACTQLVKYPSQQGPSSLPKNIDLLRLIQQLQDHNPQKPNNKIQIDKPVLAQDFDFFVSPLCDDVFVEDKERGYGLLKEGNKKVKVKLFKVGNDGGLLSGKVKGCVFKLSYVAKVFLALELDGFGHVSLSLSEVLVVRRAVHEGVMELGSGEKILSVQKLGRLVGEILKKELVLSLECLLGKNSFEELVDRVDSIISKRSEDSNLDCSGLCTGLMEKVSSLLESKTVWARLSHEENKEHFRVLGELCWVPMKRSTLKKTESAENSSGENQDQSDDVRLDKDIAEALVEEKVKFKVMQGHIDSVTGFAIGGGFLFSSSFDKTVQVWSLQDFSQIHTFKGHEHKVMAVIYVDEELPLCISGDGGGGIFVWSTSVPMGKEPLKKWYEQKDWRYSGIHALTTAGNGYLYTGSGDRSVKAWSLQDGTLSCIMDGHKSVVSTLAAHDGILYSGSWDGTIRLWSLTDHSPLTVLGNDLPGTATSVLSLIANQNILVAALENGQIKVWRDDVFKKSTQCHGGAILACVMEGKWLFTGGWDKIVNVQELFGDEFQESFSLVMEIGLSRYITMESDQKLTRTQCLAWFNKSCTSMQKSIFIIQGENKKTITMEEKESSTLLNSQYHSLEVWCQKQV